MVLPDILGIKKLFKKIDETLFRRQDRVLYDLVNSADSDELVRVLETLPHGRKKMFSLLQPEKAATVLKNLSPYLRQYVLQGAETERVLAIMNFLESDEIADLVKILPPVTRTGVLGQLKKFDPKNILQLIPLGSETAGGLMKTELVVGKPSFTVRDFTQSLREIFPSSIPKTSYVYIVDDQGRLLGSFNFNKLYLADPNITLDKLTRPFPKKIRVDEDQEQVARDFAAYDALELPVVNEQGALVGRISADDIIDVLRTEFSEDIYRLFGAFGDARVNDPYWKKVKNRLPWLAVNLLTAGFAAYIVSHFTPVLDKFVILAAYMPIIAGMGGNSATQTLGVTVRAIALDEMHSLNTWKIIVKEIFTGITNGLAMGVLVGGVAYLINANPTLSLVIAMAMTFNFFIAALAGIAIPLTMRALKKDPALASSVFVTAMTDAAGFFSFLGLATLLLR
ncbi:MAG: magnesium transporter [Candidatus Doudnabacteria bacterium]|nr:magnesium transporter [Candidatus Doudnabacteria bacterium]